MRESEASTAYVYGLIDPRSHVVRYVGQTRALKARFAEHRRGACTSTKDWVVEMWASTHVPPVLVVLAEVHGAGNGLIRDAHACETKWLKRFRRTVDNKRLRDNGPSVWDALINPME